MASEPPAVKAPAAVDDIEKILAQEATAFTREFEVDRILKAFKFNPYDVLDLDETSAPAPEVIKKKYKQLSLFIHPDKTSHARAPEAFDLLKKAESELSDETKREEINAIIAQGKMSVLKANDLSPNIALDDPKVKALKPPFKEQLRKATKDMLIEEEVRRRKAIKMNLANEGLEARKKEEEVEAKKRKAEDDKQWEETREQRVGSWRTFSNGKKKQKKGKANVLG